MSEEPLLLLVAKIWRDNLGNQVIHIVSKPWNGRFVSSITKSYSSGKSSLTCTSSLGPSNRDRWSATRFSVPFLSLISRLNSFNRRTYLISLGFASFLVIRYLMAEWSACTITLFPIK